MNRRQLTLAASTLLWLPLAGRPNPKLDSTPKKPTLPQTPFPRTLNHKKRCITNFLLVVPR